MPTVILTDESGADLGTAEIIEAHTGKGLLHKAFSVFMFNPNHTKILLQRRSEKKMLFSGYWANTCCSHPRKGEDTIEAGERRLAEECGISANLTTADSFCYRAEDGGRGVEHERDTVLVGEIDENTELKPDPAEIAAMQWIDVELLTQGSSETPKPIAPWFSTGLSIALKHYGR